MDRGARWATDQGVTELDMTEQLSALSKVVSKAKHAAVHGCQSWTRLSEQQ